MSSQRCFTMKKTLKRHLKTYFKKKAIIYSKIDHSVETIRYEIYRWLNDVDSIEGDTIMIIDDLESEWKYFTIKKSRIQMIPHQ